MSATDSDNSIDWLASDTEDHESELDFSQTRPSLSPSALGAVAHRGTEESRGERRCPSAPKRPRGVTGECRELLAAMSEKDRVFARKCAELQRYIPPLSAILNGLRSGRYRERLSSFQESVAMDRIQRIMGVLRNPYLGEKFISIILKIEEMLRSWFPHVAPQELAAEGPAPAKKLKLPPAACDPASCDAGTTTLRATDLAPPAAGTLKWLHTSPVRSPSAPPGDGDPTQDSAVSSSTDCRTRSPPRGPPPAKIRAPCLEKLLRSTESIVTRRAAPGPTDRGWS